MAPQYDEPEQLRHPSRPYDESEIAAAARPNDQLVETPDGKSSRPFTDGAPHSRACGFKPHVHGSECHTNCPTCHGVDGLPSTPKPKPPSDEPLIEYDWVVTYNASPGELASEETIRAAYYQPTDGAWSPFKDAKKSPVAFVNNATARSVVRQDTADKPEPFDQILELLKDANLSRSQVQFLDGRIWGKVDRG